jgi:hypothetical protein
MNPYSKTVKNVGYFGEGEYKARINNKQTDAYTIWNKILTRSYSNNFHETRPSYKNVTVCKEWHNFQVFAKWYYKNEIKGYQIDKDLLSEEEKKYSPKTCVFLPPSINSFLTNKQITNTSGCIGVCSYKGKWIAKISIKNKTINIGVFDTLGEASEHYKKARAVEAEKVKNKMKKLGYWSEKIISKIK